MARAELAKNDAQGMRWDRIAKARALIECGSYDHPDLHKDFLAKCIDSLRADLENCPVGAGDRYRDLAAEVLAISLKDVVEVTMMRKEVRISGGQADIEMPLQIENLDVHPLWLAWYRRYDVRFILVEVKNQKERAQPKAVSQLKGYLDGGKRGNLGLLVSRSGFTDNALKRLSDIAKGDAHLILPFDNNDLCALLRMSVQPAKKTMRLFRRKETRLLQSG